MHKSYGFLAVYLTLAVSLAGCGRQSPGGQTGAPPLGAPPPTDTAESSVEKTLASLEAGHALLGKGQREEAYSIYEEAGNDLSAAAPAETAPGEIEAAFRSGDYDGVVGKWKTELSKLGGVELFVGRGVHSIMCNAQMPWLGSGMKVIIYGNPWEEMTRSVGRMPGLAAGPEAWSAEAFYALPRHDHGAVLVYYYYGRALEKLGRTEEAVDSLRNGMTLAEFEVESGKFYRELYVPRKRLAAGPAYSPAEMARECDGAIRAMKGKPVHFKLRPVPNWN